MTTTLFVFLAGAVTLGYFASALFFLRFWKRSGDELFLSFAAAFTLLGVGQTVLVLANIPEEDRSSLYLIRLLAFAIILFAIIRKNRSAA
jgi:Family of unknown function (DUF5985)